MLIENICLTKISWKKKRKSRTSDRRIINDNIYFQMGFKIKFLDCTRIIMYSIVRSIVRLNFFLLNLVSILVYTKYVIIRIIELRWIDMACLSWKDIINRCENVYIQRMFYNRYCVNYNCTKFFCNRWNLEEGMYPIIYLYLTVNKKLGYVINNTLV